MHLVYRAEKLFQLPQKTFYLSASKADLRHECSGAQAHSFVKRLNRTRLLVRAVCIRAKYRGGIVLAARYKYGLEQVDHSLRPPINASQ